jgi:hypothetical protein
VSGSSLASGLTRTSERIGAGADAHVAAGCRNIPVREEIKHDDAVANGFKAAGSTLLIPLVVTAAAADERASAPE